MLSSVHYLHHSLTIPRCNNSCGSVITRCQSTLQPSLVSLCLHQSHIMVNPHGSVVYLKESDTGKMLASPCLSWPLACFIPVKFSFQLRWLFVAQSSIAKYAYNAVTELVSIRTSGSNASYSLIQLHNRHSSRLWWQTLLGHSNGAFTDSLDCEWSSFSRHWSCSERGRVGREKGDCSQSMKPGHVQ